MIHIVGASGYIGNKLEMYLEKRGIVNIKLYSEVENKKYIKLDLLDFDKSIVDTFNTGDIVILLAAISSPDICEKNYNYARLVNVVGTKKLIEECLKRKVKVLFFSSDVVYGFNQGINDENTQPNPHGNYAKMKFEIEKSFIDNKLFKSFRLSYVLSDKDKFITYLEECKSTNTIPEVFNGFYRNVIYIDDVLECIYKLIVDFYVIESSIVNICGNECLSRVDLANIYSAKHNLKFVIIDVPNEMLKSRPNIIHTKSLHIKKILGREPKKIIKI